MERANAINVYVCPKCGHRTVTVNRVEGVTSFLLKCRSIAGCDEFAQSSLYRVDQSLRPDWEWYRPDEKELEAATEEVKRHIANGGLMLRKLDGAGRERYGFRTRFA